MENVNNEVTSTDIKFFFNGVKIIKQYFWRKRFITVTLGGLNYTF